jgi:hypothetical protein
MGTPHRNGTLEKYRAIVPPDMIDILLNACL